MGKVNDFLDRLESSRGGDLGYWLRLEKELDMFVKNEAIGSEKDLLKQSLPRDLLV